MTRGAWMRRQHDEGLKYWFAPRENEKPFAESERAQRWRLSLASLLFITVLLSDHLWFCAEAKLTRTRDKRSDEGLAITDTGEYPNTPHRHRIPTSPDPHRLAREQDAIFVGNSTKSLWRMDACHPDSLSKDCFTFTDAETVCLGLSGGGGEGTQLAYVNLSDLYLSFCNSYSLLDLFLGSTSPVDLNCTLDMAMGVDLPGCSECVRAYQRLDLEAEENYREFELLVQKYETDVYSVRTCMEECKMVYKPWLCSQYFQTTQMHCSKRIPCGQYCLEVQQRCPFVLPDNDDLIHGGSPSFICTGFCVMRALIPPQAISADRFDYLSRRPRSVTMKATVGRPHHLSRGGGGSRYEELQVIPAADIHGRSSTYGDSDGPRRIMSQSIWTDTLCFGYVSVT
ncbi:hypothetical protein F2P81_021290, partial [Scophthalmus maximus]